MPRSKQPGQARNKTSPTTIASKVKAAKAVQLRMEGQSFPDIAKLLGYNSRQAAHDAVVRALKETLREPAEELIRLDLERLDQLWQVSYLNAMGGDVQAIASCMKLMERRAKLLGLDAPAKQEVTGKDGEPLAPPILNIVIGGEPKDSAPTPQAR